MSLPCANKVVEIGMTKSSFAQRMALTSLFPNDRVGMTDPISIGFLAPLSGPVSSWGLPGLNGCRLWTEWLNRSGGILIGGRRYPLRLVPYDCGYDADRASEGARHLVLTERVKLLMMLGRRHFYTAKRLSERKPSAHVYLASE